MSDTRTPAELAALPVFPLADRFPFVSDEDALKLAQSIEVEGLHHPVVLFRHADPETGELVEQLLDGRNRLRAIGQTNLTAVPVAYFEGGWADAVFFVLAENVHRRHLDTWQIAGLTQDPDVLGACADRARANQLAALKQNAGTVTQKIVERDGDDGRTRSNKEAAALAIEAVGGGSNREYVRRMGKLQSDSPDLYADVLSGDVRGIDAWKEYTARTSPGAGAHAGDKAISDAAEHPLVAAADRILERLAGLRGDLRKQDSLGRSALDLMASHEQVELFAILAKVGELADL